MHDRNQPRAPALALSFREAARLLKIDRATTLHALVAAGRLTPIPWGHRQRLPLEQVQELARTGFTLDGKPARARKRRGVPAPGVGARIRDLEVEP